MPIIPITSFFKENKEFLMLVRESILMFLDALERGMGMSPTTAEIRKIYKGNKLDNIKE